MPKPPWTVLALMLIGCDPGNAPDAEPQPVAEPQPSAEPQPIAEPQPAPAPEMPPTPTIDDVVLEAWATWFDGRVHTHLAHDGRLGTLYLAVGDTRINNFDTSGRGEYSRPLQVGRPFAANAHHAVAERPAVVRVVDGADIELMTIPVEDPVVHAVGDPCSPHSGRAHCPLNTLCAWADMTCGIGDAACEPGGRCVSVEVHAARPHHIAVEIEGAVAPQWNLFLGRGADAAHLQPEPIEERLIYQSDTRRSADLYQNFVPVALNVGAGLPDRRASGEDCDPLSMRNVCSADLVCEAGACGPSVPPRLDEAVVFHDGETLAFRATGHDPNGDVHQCVLMDPSGAFRLFSTHSFFDARIGSAQFIREGDRFECYGSYMPLRPVQVGEVACVAAADTHDLSNRVCAPILADPPRRVAGVGERCDAAGMIRQCEPNTWCSITADERVLRCRAAIECPTYTPVPQLALDVPLPIDEAGLGGFGAACALQDGVVGYHFEFVAPEAGAYIFDSNSASGAFTLRHECGLLHTAFACTGEDSFLEVELDANQAVTVIYSSPDAADGAIEVLVTRP